MGLWVERGIPSVMAQKGVKYICRNIEKLVLGGNHIVTHEAACMARVEDPTKGFCEGIRR